MKLIDKDKVETILRNLWKEDDGHNSEHRICYNKALQEVQCEIDALELKEEVTTTDAFIEKAEKWLNEHILDYVYAKEWGQGVGIEGELFEDFKNAMKGE